MGLNIVKPTIQFVLKHLSCCNNSKPIESKNLTLLLFLSLKDNESTLNAKNMKRESKVYSFKEQQEEIALRRELEEKKRREGKIKEPELTPKQKEAIRLQLEKEGVIRNALTVVSKLSIFIFQIKLLIQFRMDARK